MNSLADLKLPPGFELVDAVRNADGETNHVYRCQLRVDAQPVTAFIKIGRTPSAGLFNEFQILRQLEMSGLPVPRVRWFDEIAQNVLITEALPGRLIWDYLDPRRELYHPDQALTLLSAYGESLARIHALPVAWQPQVRNHLHRLIGQEQIDDKRFREICGWVMQHPHYQGEIVDPVFVHGDLNTASVLIQDHAVSGIVDWEFAGQGWREFDLAWILRARQAFLNTPQEREAILGGYSKHASYDHEALRLCEVLVYLHFAHWTGARDYRDFALEKARQLARRR
jgi:Ser/Thr protein kinase RdoA (MazF antagonist)